MRTIDIIIGLIIVLIARKYVKKLTQPFNTLVFLIVTALTIIFVMYK